MSRPTSSTAGPVLHETVEVDGRDREDPSRHGDLGDQTDAPLLARLDQRLDDFRTALREARS